MFPDFAALEFHVGDNSDMGAEKHKKYTQVSFIIQVYLKSLEGMLSRSANVSRLRSIVLFVSDKFVAASCGQLNWKDCYTINANW